jgi:hypothetical protein
MQINLDDKKLVKVIYKMDDDCTVEIAFSDGDIVDITKTYLSRAEAEDKMTRFMLDKMAKINDNVNKCIAKQEDEPNEKPLASAQWDGTTAKFPISKGLYKRPLSASLESINESDENASNDGEKFPNTSGIGEEIDTIASENAKDDLGPYNLESTDAMSLFKKKMEMLSAMKKFYETEQGNTSSVLSMIHRLEKEIDSLKSKLINNTKA